MTAGLAGAVILNSWTPSVAASPDGTPVATETPFASPVYPYTMILPSGWRSIAASPQDTGDLFQGPDATARVGSRGPVPDQTVSDRVAANRVELADQACTTDPAADQSTTLGGEVAVEWQFTCADALTLAVNTIYQGVGYRLSVTVPMASAAEAPTLLDRFARTFSFTVGLASPDASPDLTAIEASLRGTWRTEWAPAQLWIASVAAAGLDPQAGVGAGDWAASLGESGTHRETLRFKDGQMVEFGAADGGGDEFGSQAGYHLLDQDTIEAITPDGAITTRYDFTLRDDVLAIDVMSDSDPADLIPQTSIFETLPFTRVP